jgi:tetratricopeptide (TPR) repeat protein
MFASASAQQPTLHDPSSAPLNPSAPEIESARRLIASGHFTEAEAMLNAYLRSDDLSADARELLAYALLRDNKPKESLSAYTSAAALRSPSAEDLKHVAQDYALLNDFADADKWIRLSVKKDPGDADAWYNLGRIQYNEQLFADAVHSYEQVLALSPKSVKAENNLGLACEGLNQLDRAVAAYRQAIAWQNAGPPAAVSEQPLLNLAIVLLHQGQLAEAKPLLVEAVAIAPKDPRTHEQLGHLYLQQTEYPSARKELEAALALDPSSSGLHFLLGQTYRRLGLAEEAQREFAAARRLGTPATPPKPE